MTLHPPRLRDDPELRGAFLALDELLVTYDLDRVRPAPEAAPAEPQAAPSDAPARGSPRWLAGVGGATALGLLLAWLLWSSATPAPEVQPAPDSPAPTRVEVRRPEPQAPPGAVVAPAPPEPAIVRPSPPAPIVRSTGIAPAAADPSGPVEPPELVEPAEPVAAAPPAAPVEVEAATLPAELERMREARAALDRGDPTASLAVLADYERAFPEGRLLAQVDLARLPALQAAGDWAGVEEVAARLEARSDLSGRAAEFRAQRIVAVARLGRCDEALELATPEGRAVMTEVRRHCR